MSRRSRTIDFPWDTVVDCKGDSKSLLHISLRPHKYLPAVPPCASSLETKSYPRLFKNLVETPLAFSNIAVTDGLALRCQHCVRCCADENSLAALARLYKGLTSNFIVAFVGSRIITPKVVDSLRRRRPRTSCPVRDLQEDAATLNHCSFAARTAFWTSTSTIKQVNHPLLQTRWRGRCNIVTNELRLSLSESPRNICLQLLSPGLFFA